MSRIAEIWEGQDKALFSTDEADYYWDDFKHSVLSLSQAIRNTEEDDWALFFENPAKFSVAFWALVYSGKNIHCYSNFPHEEKDLPFLTDDSSSSALPVILIKQEDSIETSVLFDKHTDSTIFLYTSGSTGQSKKVEKPLSLIDRELQELFDLWENRFRNSQTYTTVSHQHFYGLLFSVLLPIVSFSTIQDKRLAFPESLLRLKNGPVNLIASPAFLKRVKGIKQQDQINQIDIRIFSSGGFLPLSVADDCFDLFNQPVIEIYGSTETGGIAWKESPEDKSWKLFNCTNLDFDKDNNALLSSEYIIEDSYLLEDELEILSDGRFILHGRKDSIVKIEDKRISLNEIENRLMESGFLSDAFVTVMEGRRQYTAVAIELNENGLNQFKTYNKKEINHWFREWLKPHFHPTVIPKKWRYPEKIPRNIQGKVEHEKAINLFQDKDAMQGSSLIDTPSIVSIDKTDNSYVSVLSFPEKYRYFNGHFPEMKILPALAQINWIISVLSDEYGLSPCVSKIPRVKFKNPIFPDQKVSLKITFSKEWFRVSFEYRNADNSLLLSSGKIDLKEKS